MGFQQKHDSGAEMLHIRDKIFESSELETITPLSFSLISATNVIVFDLCVKIQKYQILGMAEKFHSVKCFINQKLLNILTWDFRKPVDIRFWYNIRYESGYQIQCEI